MTKAGKSASAPNRTISPRARAAAKRDADLLRSHAHLIHKLGKANKLERRELLRMTHSNEKWARALAALTRVVVANGYARVPRGLQSKVYKVMGPQRTWKTIATAIGGRPGASHATGEGFFSDLANTVGKIAPLAPLAMKVAPAVMSML